MSKMYLSVVCMIVFVWTAFALEEQPIYDLTTHGSANGEGAIQLIQLSNGDFWELGIYYVGLGGLSIYLGQYDVSADTWSGVHYALPQGANSQIATQVVPVGADEFVYSGSYNNGRVQAFGMLVDEDGEELDFFDHNLQDPGLERFYSVTATSDGGFVFVGQHTPNLQTPVSGYMVKTDEDFNIKWTLLNLGRDLYNVIEHSSGDYIAVGYDEEGCSPYVCRIEDNTTSGSVEWEYSAAVDENECTEYHSVKELSDGTLAVAGGYLISRVSAAGSTLWHRHTEEFIACSPGYEDLIITQQGDIVALGFRTTGFGEIIIAKKLLTDGSTVWEHELVNDELVNYSAVSIIEIGTDLYKIGGSSEIETEFWISSDYYIGEFAAMAAPAELTIEAINSNPSSSSTYELQWDAVTNADHYVVYGTDDLNDQEEDWTVITTTTSTSYSATATDNLHYFKVAARRTEGGENYFSARSNAVGYYRFDAPGFTQGVASATPFGLPFIFWEVTSFLGDPVYGEQTSLPSDIILAQATPGDLASSDKIVNQNNAQQAYRPSGFSPDPWVGTLEENETMINGHAYWFVNKSGATISVLLCGQITSGGAADVSIPAPPQQGQTYATPYSWMESDRVPMGSLELVDGTDKFLGGVDIGVSDLIVSQSGGLLAWYNTNTEEWGGTLTHVEPGKAYWIVNKHTGHPWVYSY